MNIDKLRKVQIPDFLIALDLFKLLFNCRSYRMIYIIILVGCNFYVPEVNSAFDKKEVGASSFGIGNAAVAIDEFLFALYYNPAALSTANKFQMAFTVQNYFGISDLNAVDMTTCFSVAGHPLSFAINRFGDRKYQEIQFTAGSRFEIINNCAIGFSVQCYIIKITGYGQTLAWGANLSVLYKLLPEISVGALVTNLNQPAISEAREKLPQTMSIGFCYYPVSVLMVSFEIFQDTRFRQEYKVGCAYQVISFLTIRAGVEDQLDLYSYGLGIDMNWINVDYSLRTHSVLGVSHIATVSIIL
jgi:hypothetical protein